MTFREFASIYRENNEEFWLKILFDTPPAVWASRLEDRSMFPCTANETWLTFQSETLDEEIERRKMYNDLYEYNERYKIKQAHIKEINCCRGEYEC